MDIQQLVPNLELCKELRKNEYPQNSVFVWYENAGEAFLIQRQTGFETFPEKTVAAPTASEIGEQLPARVKLVQEEENGVAYLTIAKYSNKDMGEQSYKLKYESAYDELERNWHAKLVDAMAEMWLHLKKNEIL